MVFGTIACVHAVSDHREIKLRNIKSSLALRHLHRFVGGEPAVTCAVTCPHSPLVKLYGGSSAYKFSVYITRERICGVKRGSFFGVVKSTELTAVRFVLDCYDSKIKPLRAVQLISLDKCGLVVLKIKRAVTAHTYHS